MIPMPIHYSPYSFAQASVQSVQQNLTRRSGGWHQDVCGGARRQVENIKKITCTTHIYHRWGGRYMHRHHRHRHGVRWYRSSSGWLRCDSCRNWRHKQRFHICSGTRWQRWGGYCWLLSHHNHMISNRR